MEVTFETMAGKVFTVEFRELSTVMRMKMAVETKEGYPVESQRFFSKGEELHDDMDAALCSIAHGSHVRLILPGDGYELRVVRVAKNERLRVVVSGAARELQERQGVAVNVSSLACTFGRLKELVEERTYGALPAARLSLLVGGVEMRNHMLVGVVAEYGRVRPDRLDVTAVLRPPHDNDDAPAPAPAKNVHGETSSNSKLANCGWFWRCAYRSDDDM
ncbi:hypothetical protein GUJ93_ZPchr0012g21817 [Zizania palustris]|uniref:Ubiquitin-like domain-containing protein n=1 Tax=Zizania palustris TaxID=103762 RepID=A0A8J5WKJ1_ZIZPA|nr:hypothetical protein GUJ93_ZPchr0012g21817 [Zizania palustris]